MGGEVTPRSDLYSLGAMLYEMVTGRPPFLGDDSVAIIGQHINTPPVAPTWHNNKCPRPLEALIMRLLAKNPAERPESATDVLSALDAIDLTTSVEQPGADVEEAHALDSLAGGVFVGRQQEMGDLKAALEDALSGRGRLVTLVGEPGIGKSRTAQELATYAGLRHAQVLWGRCYEGEGAPPYWPWVQAIRSYVQDRDAEELRSEMGAGAADIAGIVSDVSAKLPGLATPPDLEPEQARFRLFDSMTAFLKSASRRQPLVLVLDDLHWADHPSLLLLEFVARELAGSRLLVIGTYRDMELSRRHPLSLTLGELNRERLFQRVLLRGLAQEDVGRFIDLVSGIAPPRGMVEAVHRQTEGNPLFVTEVVRLLVQEGELTQEKAGQRDSWSVRIPEGVREVIGRRLDRLSQRCNEALTIASVVGREFELSQLSPLIQDMSEDRLLEVLDEALGARVIEEMPQAMERYQFTHALIQEILANELSAARRVRLHARIAESLETLYGEGAEAHAPELAHHFSEAQSVLGTDRTVHYSLLSGERALAAYAHEDALTHFREGLTARGIELSGNEVATDEEAAELLFGLGRAQVAILPVDQLHNAVDTLRRAFEYYSEMHELDRAVAIAETPIPPTAGHHIGMSQLLARALELVPATSLAAGRLLSLRGRVSYIEEGDYAGAQEAFNESLEIARQEASADLELRTLVDAAEVAFYRLQIQDFLTLSLRAVALTSKVDDPRSEALANFHASISHTIRGEPEPATQYADAGIVAAQRIRHHLYLARTLCVREYVSRLLGQWQTASEFIGRGLAVSPTDGRLLFGRVLVECQLGESDLAEAHLDELIEVMQLNPSGPTVDRAFVSVTAALAARITGVVDRSEVAEEAAHTILSNSSAIPIVVEMTRYGAALLAVERGDAAAARDQYGSLALSGLGVVFGIHDSQILGLLAHTMGDLDQAAAHFEDALAFCRRAGYRPVVAWICCDYADLLRERDGEG
ncbi:MAG: AAA family ATPase, partial [Candidatus Acidoferrales bacterium]